jgi:bloom syndrome protein
MLSSLRRETLPDNACVLQEYRKLGNFRAQFPLIPIMVSSALDLYLHPHRSTATHPGTQALTASATSNVERDIIDSLRLSREHLFRCVEPFNRTNLYYEVRYRPEPDQYRLNDIAKFISALHNKAPVDPKNSARKTPVSGIVYCRSRASVGRKPLLCRWYPSLIMLMELAVQCGVNFSL